MLYALSQGIWDLENLPENAGAPASHNSGALVRVEGNGMFATIADSLDQPTSMEIIGGTAYAVTLTGTVLKVDGI